MLSVENLKSLNSFPIALGKRRRKGKFKKVILISKLRCSRQPVECTKAYHGKLGLQINLQAL